MAEYSELLVRASYFLVAVLFIVGLKRMSSPVTARGGILWAGVGMLIATLVTFAWPGMSNYPLIIVAIAIGGIIAWVSGKRVPMTGMPQMVALYNGMGGGSAGAIGAVVLLGGGHDTIHMTLAILGGLIGTVSFSGSLIAFTKLQGWADRQYIFPGQQLFNALVFIATVAAGAYLFVDLTPTNIAIFFGLAFAVGILMTLPIGGADMPVVISLYNALTGLAVAFEGFVLQNEAMIIAGTVVGAAGTLLTQLMARAMNRSLGNVLFSGFGATGGGAALEGEMKPIDAADAAVMMAYADKVIIVPGYGMAVAQAQHKVWELTRQLLDRGVKVKFAIHPVAGRMPGHMNVLLAEAGVPYDLIYDLDEINAEFKTADVSLVIGANDVVNPVAKTDPSSPIYGMPVLDAEESHNVIVIKRGQGRGFAGIDNALFLADNTRMLYGDGQVMAGELLQQVKQL
ncbi:MAG: NAD(P)(+) transhydrogenase (Re/Si-specific) subunit beta [Gammaproteobacteria bacterium]|nr:MAG: NAD(P)(+) transhydrogenase (Re/Si-specific) subunit beta [Gammaproteobacteria bacterium]